MQDDSFSLARRLGVSFGNGQTQRRQQRRLQVEELEARHVLSGTWTPLTNLFADSGGMGGAMVLLSDGTVMVQGYTSYQMWYRLIPDAKGSYVNGQWSPTAPMNNERATFSSVLLADGRFMVLGGEDPDYSNLCEIYDPVADTWTEVAPVPSPPFDPSTKTGGFGDQPSYLLADGTVLTPNGGNDTQTFLYYPATNTWNTPWAGPPRLYDDTSYEENWVKLPDNSILAVPTRGTQLQIAQRFVPGATHATDAWVEAGTTVDQLSYDGPPGDKEDPEIGPGVLLPDGRVWQIGGNNLTGLYSPPALTGTASGSWIAGPSVPNDILGNVLSCGDVGAAVTPDGHVIFAASPWWENPPTSIFEYTPDYSGGIGTITPLIPAVLDYDGDNNEFLTLPNGQILFTAGNYSQLWVYTPDGKPQDAWRPKVKSVSLQDDGTYLLKGKQLNGMSDGAYYGDDAEMATNYPIVRLTKQNGKVWYARSFNWSSVGVQTGKLPVTTQFVLPPTLPFGSYKLTVIASGIASKSFAFENTDSQVMADSLSDTHDVATKRDATALLFSRHAGRFEGMTELHTSGQRGSVPQTHDFDRSALVGTNNPRPLDAIAPPTKAAGNRMSVKPLDLEDAGALDMPGR